MKIVSRKEAREQGLPRYYTGKPCPHDHRTERATVNSTCVGCQLEAQRGTRKARNAAMQEWRKKNPGSWRKYMGMPKPPYPPPPACECCGHKTDLALDHCHRTGKFRGWLCRRCNLGIGSLGDDLLGVRQAVEYLTRIGDLWER